MSSNDSQLRAEQSGASDDSIQQVHAGLQKEKPEKAEKKSIKTASLDDLKSMLSEALADEDYERASRLRDELKRREGTN